MVDFHVLSRIEFVHCKCLLLYYKWCFDISVQVQATVYLGRKTSEQQKLDLPSQKRCLASTSFRNGIKRQNMRKLYERQSLLQVNGKLQPRHPNLRSNQYLTESFWWSISLFDHVKFQISACLFIWVINLDLYLVFSLFTVERTSWLHFTPYNIYKADFVGL